MAAETIDDPLPAAWAAALLESDRRYFEAGADLIAFSGASIAVLRGAEALAAGCVVQRIDADLVAGGSRAETHANAWLGRLESRIFALRAPRARLYLERPHPTLDAALSRRGYRRRTEQGFVRASVQAAHVDVDLVPADSEDGWSQRRELVARGGALPDGFAANPDLWIEMERRRSQAGYMRPYLARRGSDIVAAACAAPSDVLLRLKNVVVDPAHRRRGVATALAARFAALALEQGFAAAGCFAIEGEPGMGIYGRAGYRAATSQIEWVRDLGGAP